MLISNSIFLFLVITRVVLQDLQFKIIFIYFILDYFTALWVSQYLKQAALAPFFPLSEPVFFLYASPSKKKFWKGGGGAAVLATRCVSDTIGSL